MISEEFHVEILDSDGISVANWIGPVPSPGEYITVKQYGEGCAEPMRLRGIVVSRQWEDVTRFPVDSGWRHRTTCYVTVEWSYE